MKHIETKNDQLKQFLKTNKSMTQHFFALIPSVTFCKYVWFGMHNGATTTTTVSFSLVAIVRPSNASSRSWDYIQYHIPRLFA